MIGLFRIIAVASERCMDNRLSIKETKQGKSGKKQSTTIPPPLPYTKSLNRHFNVSVLTVNRKLL